MIEPTIETEYLLGAFLETEVQALSVGIVPPAVQQRAIEILAWWSQTLDKLTPDDRAILAAHKAAKAQELRDLQRENRRLKKQAG